MESLLTLAVAAPPSLDIDPRETAEAAATAVTALVFLACLVVACRHWRREGSALGVALLFGGALAVLQEPMVDLLGAIYVRSDLTVFETWGRGMPAWAILAYGIYWGFQPYMLSRLAARGLTLREFRRLIGVCFILNLIIEWPTLGLGVHVYFGEQPFEVLGLPLQWLVINCVGMVAVAAAAHVLRDRLTGPWGAAGLLIPVVLVPAASMGSGLVVFTAFNSPHTSDATLWLASAITMAIGLAIIEFLGRLIASPTSPPPPAAASPAERTHVAA